MHKIKKARMKLGDRQSGVVLENVQKTFVGGAVGVEQVDLQVGAGELVTLVGESGSGKTTTLRLVAGLERATRGVIRLGGCDVSQWAPHRRRVALVGQRPVLHPRWTVAKHLEFAWALRHGPRLGSWGWCRQVLKGVATDVSYRRRRDDVVAAWGVDAILERRAGELSGGQQQQACLARAMMGDPQAYLLDEPFSAIDVSRRIRLRWQFRQWQRRLGRPVLYVTHDHSEALALGDRVAVLRAGRIAQIGTPAEVYRKPDHRGVAESLGAVTMNFLRGGLSRQADGDWIVTPYFQNKVGADRGPGAVHLRRHEPSPLTVGIRPEDLLVERPGAGPAGWPKATGQVVGVERQGDFDLVHVSLGDASRAAADRDPKHADIWLARAAAWSEWQDGDDVEVRWHSSNLHCFDPASGENLTV